MTVPIILLALALGAAFLALLVGRFVGHLLLVIGVAAIAYGISTKDSNTMMAIAYTLAFGWPVLLGTVALGVASGASLRKRKYLFSILPMLPFVYFIWHTEVTGKRESSEKRQATEFLANNKQLMLLMGGKVVPNLTSTTQFNDKNRTRYDFSITGPNGGEKPVHAIVDVSRQAGQPVFTLACVTSLYSGQRETGVDDCAQSRIPLPDWDPTNESHQQLASSVNEEAARCEFRGFIPSPSRYSVQAVLTDNGRPTGYQIDSSGQEGTQIDVTVNNPTEPVVLALSTGSPNIWNISWTQNTHIVAVLVGGEYRQVVTGLPKDTPVILLTRAEIHACDKFNIDRHDAAKRNAVIKHFFGRTIDGTLTVTDGRAVLGAPLQDGESTTADMHTSPSDYFDRSAPRAGALGLADGLEKGLLRRATRVDAQEWGDTTYSAQLQPGGGGNLARLAANTYVPNAYVVQAPFVIPAGLNSIGVTFYVTKGVPKPVGNTGTLRIFYGNATP